MHPHSARYYVSLIGGHLIVLSTLFLIQDLTLGLLSFWNPLRIGPVPIRPFVFIATSLFLDRRYFRVYGVESRHHEDRVDR